MPMPAFLTIEAENQGAISDGAGGSPSIGNEAQEGHEDEIMVQAVNHSIIIPRDPQSGNATGTRIHQPFKFVCTLNKAVPLMYNALTKGEKLTKVELKWYRTEAGENVNFFTTSFEDGLIVDMNLEMPHCKDPANGNFTQIMSVSMSYRKIEWEHVTAGTMGSDDWRTGTPA